jgi:ABC-2 type transport system ATP-binding protein
MTPVLEARALNKRFGRRWALRDCTLTIPAGAVVGLAGPNGAGKSTLLELAVALLAPTGGEVMTLGVDPVREPGILARVGYVAQDAPLYRAFTIGETLEFARATNPGWDRTAVDEIVRELPHERRVSSLSAGDRARLALCLALGKRPSLVLLDEPFARLDPLAAREFLQVLMDGVADTGATVMIASHVIADIERVSDHIVLLSDGHVRLQGDVDALLASHRLLSGARRPLGRIAGVEEVVRQTFSGRQMTLLARRNGRVVDPSWSVDEIGLEDLLLAYMAPQPLPQVSAQERKRLRWHG